MYNPENFSIQGPGNPMEREAEGRRVIGEEDTKKARPSKST